MDPTYSVSKILWIWTPHIKNEGKSIFPITIHYVNKYPLLDFIVALSSLEGVGSNAEDAEALAAVSAKHNSSALRSIMYSFIPRNGNSVAHLLAKHAKELSSCSYWIEEAPSFLFSALASDVLLSNSEWIYNIFHHKNIYPLLIHFANHNKIYVIMYILY